MSRIILALHIAVLVSLAAACSSRAEPPVAASAPAPVAQAPAATPARKAFAATAEDELGTLPADVGLAVGQPMPDVAVEDAKGKPVRLSELRANAKGRWLLLVFYRGGWCPYCNFEIHELTQAYPEFARRGALPVAISVDRPEEAAETQATYEIPFPVLSDPGLVAHTAFRVVHTADGGEVERLRKFGIDIEAASGRTHHQFAIPALFIVDRDGTILWSHADPDYKTRPTNAQLLAVLDRLGVAP